MRILHFVPQKNQSTEILLHSDCFSVGVREFDVVRGVNLSVLTRRESGTRTLWESQCRHRSDVRLTSLTREGLLSRQAAVSWSSIQSSNP